MQTSINHDGKEEIPCAPNSTLVKSKNPWLYLPIRDLPSRVDSLGKGFEAFSSHLENLITHSPGGISIALLGSWGTGKSSVLEMLESKFQKEKKDIVVFIYDAWIHDNDQLRRAYLESLVNHLYSVEWIKGNYWRDQLDVLAGRRVKKVKRKRNIITFSSCAIAAISFILVLAKEFDPFLLFEKLPEWSFAVSFLLLGFCLWLLKSENLNLSESVVTQTGDITSLEFEKSYRDLLKDVLCGHTQRKLVLCIDNLDRLESDHLLRLWSTMRIFTDSPRNASTDSWMDQLFLLVPFDPKSMTNIWLNQNKKSQFLERESTGKFASEEAEDEKKRLLADSFLKKTFQLILPIPFPSSADSHKYLRKLFEDILKEHYEPRRKDVDKVILMYSSLEQGDGWSISPREMKLFVNSVGSYFFRWEGEKQLTSIAAYILLKDSINNWYNLFLGGRLPDPQLEKLLPENWQDDFFALHFNLPAEKVYHMIMKEKINESLTKKLDSDIHNLVNVYGFEEAFKEVFYSYKRSFEKSIWQLALAARSLNVIEYTDNQIKLDDYWQTLRESIVLARDWGNLNNDSGKLLALILRTAEKEELEKIVIPIFQTIADEVIEVQHSEFWIKGINDLLIPVVDRNLEAVIQAHLRLPERLDLSKYASLVESNQLDQRLVPLLRPKRLNVQTYRHLMETGTYSRPYLFFINAGINSWAQWELDGVVQIIVERFKDIGNLTNTPLYVETLLDISRVNESAKVALEAFCKSDTIYHWNINFAYAPLYFTVLYEFYPAGDPAFVGPDNVNSKVKSYLDVLHFPDKHLDFLKSVHEIASQKQLLNKWFESVLHCVNMELIAILANFEADQNNGLRTFSENSQLRKINLGGVILKEEDFQILSKFPRLIEVSLLKAGFDSTEVKLPNQLDKLYCPAGSFSESETEILRSESPELELIES